MVMDAARAVAMPSLSPATVAARPSSRRLHKVAAMATQKPTSGTRRGTTVYFPVGEPGPRQTTSGKAAAPPVKLLTNVEKLRLLTKAEKAGLLGVALLLLAAGPAVVYLVPEEYPWEVAVQAVVALACVVGGSTAFAASSFVSKLQSSSS
uniref:Uncharacterized protein n=1 Tax=Oryza barthii TaxID=65489 RepID=A0A0D3HW02_9ORYZ